MVLPQREQKQFRSRLQSCVYAEMSGESRTAARMWHPARLCASGDPWEMLKSNGAQVSGYVVWLHSGQGARLILLLPRKVLTIERIDAGPSAPYVTFGGIVATCHPPLNSGNHFLVSRSFKEPLRKHGWVSRSSHKSYLI